MHNQNLDLSIEEITKIEGTASVDIKIRDGVVQECHFGIVEMQRFFQEAVRSKSITSLPHLLARICGTCSNAHLLASIASVEHGLQITVSEQTTLLRKLLNYGLMIRDHGLHLYVFVLPDLYHRESLLAFDEANEEEHALVHDCFAVKEVGNKLSILSGGRAVHAPLLTIGGFTEIPTNENLSALIPELIAIRPRILRLISVFERCEFTLNQDLKFLACMNDDFSFLDGTVVSSDGVRIPPEDFQKHLNPQDIPYSHATGYLFDGHVHFVGAMARVNLNKEALHTNTKRDASSALALFPSKNVYHNNLAQAIEMLHSVDASIALINQYIGIQEAPVAITPKEATGIGIIEAPRGTLFHRVEMDETGKVTQSKVIVPTGQNQIGIEIAIRDWVSEHTDLSKGELELEIQKIIRAYDPCMSCATHFLKLKIEH